MSKFKVGDKVRCISKDYPFLTSGKVYYVNKINGKFVEVDGVEDGHYQSRFELVEDEEQVKSKNKADRFNTGKAEFFDAPLLGLAEVAKVAAYGRSKYDKYNWKKEAPMSQYFDCAYRHLTKWWYGQDTDSESKCHHLAHAAWNLLAALEKIQTGTADDDRFDGYPEEFIKDIESLFSLNEEQKKAIQEQLDKKKGK